MKPNGLHRSTLRRGRRLRTDRDRRPGNGGSTRGLRRWLHGSRDCPDPAGTRPGRMYMQSPRAGRTSPFAAIRASAPDRRFSWITRRGTEDGHKFHGDGCAQYRQADQWRLTGRDCATVPKPCRSEPPGILAGLAPVRRCDHVRVKPWGPVHHESIAAEPRRRVEGHRCARNHGRDERGRSWRCIW